MSTGTYLDLSLHHLQPKDVDGLKREAIATRDLDTGGLAGGGILPPVAADAFGYWVNVPAPGEQDEQQRRDSFPTLMGILEHARALGCDWVHFDQDAPVDPRLPLFG